jgi:hypothetical protein
LTNTIFLLFKLSNVRILPRAADHTKNATLGGALVRQMLFQGKGKNQIADIIQKVETSTEKMVLDPKKADIEAGSEGVTDWQEGSKMLMATSGTEGDGGGSDCKKAPEAVFSFKSSIFQYNPKHALRSFNMISPPPPPPPFFL